MKIKWYERTWCRFVCWLIAKRYDEQASNYWLWNDTPFPIALPTAKQNMAALRWVITGKYVDPNPPTSTTVREE